MTPRDRPRGAALRAFLDRLVTGGLASAAVAHVERRGRLVFGAARGEESRGEAATPATRFDLSSITKPFVATLALALDASGALPLAARVGDLAPEAAGRAARTPLERLLRHRAGLVPWAPLETLCRRPAAVRARLLADDLWRARGPAYSDLGYILWALLAEGALGAPLDGLLERGVLRPLALRSVGFRPGARPGVARTALDRAREAALAAELGLALTRSAAAPPRGTVQDGNARFLGGVAGHAGLFGAAADVAALARAWLDAKAPLRRASVARALGPPAGEYALGWARRRVRGTAGAAFSAAAFGHAGSTGTTVWADPANGVVAVLLAHRASGVDWRPLRREFHRLAVAAAVG